MVVAVVAETTYFNSEDATITLSAAGTDSLILIISSHNRAALRTITAQTLNSVAADSIQNFGVDGGGRAAGLHVTYYKHANHPGSGNFTLDTTFNNSTSSVHHYVIELSGVDQTTPISTVESATATDNAVDAVLGTTLTSMAGLLAYSAANIADTTNPTAGGNLDPPASLGNLVDRFQTNSRTGWGRDDSVASSSETYDWTGDIDGSLDPWDSFVTVSFSVNAAAGGPAPTPHSPFGLPFHGPFGGPI